MARHRRQCPRIAEARAAHFTRIALIVFVGRESASLGDFLAGATVSRFALVSPYSRAAATFLYRQDTKTTKQ